MALKPFSGPPKTTASDGRNLFNVLYVEDEDANWDIAAKRLASRYRMVRARNSTEAFAELARQEFRVILMDIQLYNSQLSGIDITRVLRGTYDGEPPPEARALVGKAPPIIFVTAYTARYTRDDLMALGGDDLISKPVDFIQLTTTMTRVIVRPLTASSAK